MNVNNTMNLNLETLSTEARNTVSNLAVEAIKNSSGVFTYEGKQYKARMDAGGQLEISEFLPMKDRMDHWTQAQKDRFRILVDAAKNAAIDSPDRQFEFDNITVTVELLADGKAILHLTLATL